MCYGGTAINNILPEEDQFYDKSIEIPDYDFYSPDALGDAKELADLYYKKVIKRLKQKQDSTRVLSRYSLILYQ